MTVDTLAPPTRIRDASGRLAASEEVYRRASGALEGQRAVVDQLKAARAVIAQELHDAKAALDAAQRQMARNGARQMATFDAALKVVNEADAKLKRFDEEILPESEAELERMQGELEAAARGLHADKVRATINDLVLPADANFLRLLRELGGALEACQAARAAVIRLPEAWRVTRHLGVDHLAIESLAFAATGPVWQLMCSLPPDWKQRLDHIYRLETRFGLASAPGGESEEGAR